MSVKIKDVDKLANTSTTTVSKVFNHTGFISEETTLRVRQAAKELGYVPNKSAQILARQKTKTIIFAADIEPDTAFINPHLFAIFSGLSDFLDKKYYSVQILNVKDKAVECLEQAIEGKMADGFVLHAGIVDERVDQLIKEFAVPHLVLGKPAFPTSLCWVDTNNELSGEIAAQYLMQLGIKDIAFLGGTKNDGISQARLTGIQRYFEGRWLKLEEDKIFHGDSTRKDGFAMTEALLEKGGAKAIICANNYIAVGCMDALSLNGISVPKTVSVIAFDDFPFSRMTEPALTVVNIDMFDLGKQAGRMIIDKINHPDIQFQSFVTSPELIIRDSVVSS